MMAPVLPELSCCDSRELFPPFHAADTGLPLLVIDNALARAVVALQGAQVLSFQPHGEADYLWCSPQSRWQPGLAIRGGIPLCLPWFGPGPDGAPQHGFGRNRDWTLLTAENLANGETRLLLELPAAEPWPAWPHAARFQLEVIVGHNLQLCLRVDNPGETTLPLSCLFHSYLAVPEVQSATVDGLAGCTFIDKLAASQRGQQAGMVHIPAATDRIYLDVPASQTLRTAERSLQLTSNARCCVIWNAGDNDQQIADLGAGNHRGYLCVERGDVADYGVQLPPGEFYRLWMTLSR